MVKLFTKALQEFLINRCGEIVFSEVSPQYQTADREINQLCDEIKSLLSEESQKLLLNLNDRHNDRMTAAVNMAYQKGFAECLQLILYLTIPEAEEFIKNISELDLFAKTCAAGLEKWSWLIIPAKIQSLVISDCNRPVFIF